MSRLAALPSPSALRAPLRAPLLASLGASLGASLWAAPTLANFSFIALPDVVFALPQFPTMSAGADLDGDGLPDLVVPGRNAEGRVHVMRNTGGGLLEIELTLEFGGQTDWASLGDLDGDGTLDMAVAVRTGPRGIGIRAGLGSGDFALTGPFLGDARDVRCLDLADFDNDGDLDIAAVDYEAGALRIFRNGGNSDFTPDPPIRLVPHSGGFVYAANVTSADLDGDGWTDLLVTATGAGRMIQFRNRGDGSFEPAINRGVPTVNGSAPGLINTIPADMDGDGSLDLVSPWITGFLLQVVAVLPNDGDGDFPQIIQAPGIFGSPSFFGATADLDGDGKLDIAIGHALPGVLSLTRNLGDFQFAPGQLLPFSSFVRHVLPVDMDGDGRVDLVALDAPQNILRVLINTTPPAGEGGLAGAPPDAPPAEPLIPVRSTRGDVHAPSPVDNVEIGLWLLERP